MYLYVIYRFQNAITLARKYIFSFHKKFLSADIPFYQKQLKTGNVPQTPPPAPAPLKHSKNTLNHTQITYHSIQIFCCFLTQAKSTNLLREIKFGELYTDHLEHFLVRLDQK